jgi:hypothetical protein
MLTGHASKPVAREFVYTFFSVEIRSWRGVEPLWKVFWLSGVGCSGIIAAFYAAAVYTGRIALQQVLLLCFAVYTVWILIAVWRCAPNSRTKQWALLARLLTVAWAVNALMMLTFPQLDLVTRYLGR